MHPWFKFAGICSIVMAIVLLCVIFGGYSSLWRSQNRIRASKDLLTEACRKRQNLISKLDAFTDSSEFSQAAARLKSDARKADKILEQIILTDPLVEKDLIKALETSQTDLSSDLATLFSSLELKLPKEKLEKFITLRKEFSSAQDNIFVARKYFNKEVAYFNNRTAVFPVFLIARLFGFDEIKYTGISEDVFLSGEKTFSMSAS